MAGHDQRRPLKACIQHRHTSTVAVEYIERYQQQVGALRYLTLAGIASAQDCPMHWTMYV